MVDSESAALRRHGMSYGFRARRGDFQRDQVTSDARAMRELGIDSVALHVTLGQETFASTRVFADFTVTPSDAELRDAISAFKAEGLSVMLKPMIECQDSSWQGNITFPDGDEQIQGTRTDYWSAWFGSFEAALAHYAEIAQEAGVDIFCAGCELVGTLRQDAHWHHAIARVRSVFTGLVTFDTDHTALADVRPWFEDLDLLSVSYYVSAADHEGASVAEMITHLAPSVAELRDRASTLGLPLVFGECGCRSRLGAAITPSDYALPGRYSGEEQANYLEAVLRAFDSEPWWAGLYWWKWDERQVRPQYAQDPAGDMGFTVQGKPAEDTLRRLCLPQPTEGGSQA